MKWLLAIMFDFNSIERRSSRERESENREWRGRENMFSIIKRHFHSSYGLWGKRKNVLHSDRVSPRFSPLFVLSLFSFFYCAERKSPFVFVDRWTVRCWKGKEKIIETDMVLLFSSTLIGLCWSSLENIKIFI